MARLSVAKAEHLGRTLPLEVKSGLREFVLERKAVDDPQRAGPFEEDRLKDERRYQKALEQAFADLYRAVQRELRSTSNKDLFGGKAALTQDALEIVNNQQFWDKQAADFQSQMNDVVQMLLLRAAVDQPTRMGLAVDIDLVNQRVLELAGQYSNSWWRQLESTTRDSLRTAIQSYIPTGKPIKDLVKNIEPLFGKRRAEMIAATEVTRLYAEGNRAGYAASGVEEVEWVTARDALVCDLCGPLDGKKWPLGQEEYVPPRHPRCRCTPAPVTDSKIAQELIAKIRRGGK